MIALKLKRRGAISAALVTTMLLTACAAPRQTYITTASPADTCAPLREPFVAVVERQQEKVKQWAAIGAAAGAAGGTAIGASRGGKEALVGALIGIVVGAFAGAAIGYFVDLEKRSKDTASLRKAVFADARDDAKTGDKLVDGVIKLNACRMKALTAVAKAVQGGSDKEAARLQLAEIRSFVELDNEIIERSSQGLKKNAGIYVGALNKSGADNPEQYIESAARYSPRVKQPTFAARRPSAQPISLSRRNRKSENGVTAVTKSGLELDALQAAHLQSVDNGIADIEQLLL